MTVPTVEELEARIVGLERIVNAVLPRWQQLTGSRRGRLAARILRWALRPPGR